MGQATEVTVAKQYEAKGGVKVFAWMVSRLTKMGVGPAQILTTVGRETGRPREVPVSPLVHDDVEYLVAPYGPVNWVRNARAHPEVSLRKGRAARDVTLVEVSGGSAEVVMDYYGRQPFPRRFMDLPESPSLDDFERASGRFPVFRVEER